MRRQVGRACRAHTAGVLPACLVICLVICLGVATGATAANWELAPRVQAGYQYSDNYRLDLPGNEIDVSGAQVDASLTLRTVDPRTNFAVTPRIRATYFPNATDEDSTDYFLGASFDDKTQRRRMGFGADLSREDVVNSELPSAAVDAGLGDPDALDSGRTLARNRRDLIRLTPYFSYDLSQRYRLDLDAHYIDANFDSNVEGAQQDFSDMGASAALGFMTSPRSTLLLRALASRYETAFTSDAYGAQAEWSLNYSENSQMYVRVGMQETSFENDSSDTQVIGGLGGRWSNQRNHLFLDLTRSIGPVSSGTVVERHQLRLRLTHDVTPRVAWVVGARALRDEAVDDASTRPTREYAVGEAGVEWRVQRAWALTGTYTYLWQEYDNDPTSASSNGFLISVVYEPKRSD